MTQENELTKSDTNLSLQSLLVHETALTLEILEKQGEISEELEVMLRSQDSALASKIDSYHIVMERLEAEEEALRKRAQLLTECARKCANTVERMKEHLKYNMITFDKKTLEGNDSKFTISEEKEPSYKLKEGVDPYDLPLTIRREKTTFSLDLDTVKLAYDSLSVDDKRKIEVYYKTRLSSSPIVKKLPKGK